MALLNVMFPNKLSGVPSSLSFGSNNNNTSLGDDFYQHTQQHISQLQPSQVTGLSNPSGFSSSSENSSLKTSFTPPMNNNISAQSVFAKEKKYHCSRCELKFTRNSSLKRHIKSKHLFLKYKCDVCPNYFNKRKDYLQRHMLIKHGMSREEFNDKNYQQDYVFEDAHTHSQFSYQNEDTTDTPDQVYGDQLSSTASSFTADPYYQHQNQQQLHHQHQHQFQQPTTHDYTLLPESLSYPPTSQLPHPHPSFINNNNKHTTTTTSAVAAGGMISTPSTTSITPVSVTSNTATSQPQFTFDYFDHNNHNNNNTRLSNAVPTNPNTYKHTETIDEGSSAMNRDPMFEPVLSSKLIHRGLYDQYRTLDSSEPFSSNSSASTVENNNTDKRHE